MKVLFNWFNSYSNINAKVLVVMFFFLSVCFAILFAGLAIDGVTPGQFLAKNNAGTGGQIVFWTFVSLWALGLLTAVFAQRDK